MMILNRLADEADAAPTATPNAAAPNCYSITIFTHRWKDVRDFYVEILQA